MAENLPGRIPPQPRIRQALAASSAVIIGCGALGTHQAQWLVRMGLRRLTLVDPDVVEAGNLDRQILFTAQDAEARILKVTAASRALARIAPELQVQTVADLAHPGNVCDLIKTSDVLLDATDNFAARFLINEAAVKLGRAWIYGGVEQGLASVMSFIPHEGPCLACWLEADAAPGGTACSPGSVYPLAVAWTAMHQAQAAIRWLLGEYQPDLGVIRTHDLWRHRALTRQLARRPDCPVCQQRLFLRLEGAGRCWHVVSGCAKNALLFIPASQPRAVFDAFPGLEARLPAGGLLALPLGEQGLSGWLRSDGRMEIRGTSNGETGLKLWEKTIQPWLEQQSSRKGADHAAAAEC